MLTIITEEHNHSKIKNTIIIFCIFFYSTGYEAFELVVEIEDIPYEEVFPADLAKGYEENGVFLFERWMNRKANMRKLQQNVIRWRKENSKP